MALISGLVLFTTVIGNIGYQHQIDSRYSAVALPALALGNVYAIGLFSAKRRIGAVARVAVSGMWAADQWGPLPIARQPVAYWTANHQVAESARDIKESIPTDAEVSAHYALTSHLARREQIYSWPNPFSREMYGIDISLEGSLMAEAADVEYAVLRLPLDERNAALGASRSQTRTLTGFSM